MSYLLPVTSVLLGILVLIFGADRFVSGATDIARSMGMRPLLVGMLVVGLGTSAPEFLVSATAALQGDPGLAIGNAVGSNVANLGLVLAAGAIVSPMLVSQAAGSKDIPRLLVTTGLASLLLYDGNLSLLDGILLIGALLVLIVTMIRTARAGPLASESSPTEAKSASSSEGAPVRRGRSFAVTGMGLVLLLAGSRAVVWGATNVASMLGVSDFVIGLTVVAIGTSLPELASTIIAARRGEADLVVGNVVGSNTFNTLAVLGIPGVLSPVSELGPSLLVVDIPVMLVLTFMLAAVGLRAHRQGQARLGRRWGVAFLVVFVGHATWTALHAV